VGSNPTPGASNIATDENPVSKVHLYFLKSL
jgi:hypothetical protein